MQIDTFLARWRGAGGSERANYQLFIADLCDLLDVAKPQAFLAAARARDVLLRDFSWDPALPGGIRVTVGDPAENDRLLQSLA